MRTILANGVRRGVVGGLVRPLAPRRLAPRRPLSTTFGGLLPTLPFEAGAFNSLSLDVSTVTQDTADFGAHLMNSMLAAREEKKAAAWLRIPVDYCHYIAIAAHCGFELHHTEDRCVYMCQWLMHDVENKIPPYGTHQVGVGGLVLHRDPAKSEPEVLVIREAGRNYSKWKLPGGLLDAGEVRTAPPSCRDAPAAARRRRRRNAPLRDAAAAAAAATPSPLRSAHTPRR